MRFILDWWRRRQRALDLELLWPACKAGASSLDQAKAAFAVHAFHDRAWLVLGDEAIFAFIEGLE